MATLSLPERPNLAQLRTLAKELQRAGGAGYPLHAAQLALARRYGFASWPRLAAHVAAIAERSWHAPDTRADESSADRFLRLVCATDTASSPAAAAELLAREPDLPARSAAVAAACSAAAALARHVAARPAAAVEPAAPYGWSPLLYAAYSRLPADRAATLRTVRLLLDAGADPDDGRYFDGLPTPFTVLTGVFGGGESDPPPHPHSTELARLLLAAGADPNDGQTLYNRMFGTADDFLEVLFEYGLGTGDGGPWRRRLPDLTPEPAELVRGLLRWAVTHDQRDRVALLARHGVDVVSPFADGATPAEVALRNGNRELAEQLRGLGARPAVLDPVDALVAAAMAADAAAVAATPTEVLAAARARRPGLPTWAAAHGRPGAVDLLVGLGWDVNAYGRGDVPVEQEWETALHVAAGDADTALVRRLLELGADPTLRDARFDGTPADWAEHFGHREVAALLR